MSKRHDMLNSAYLTHRSTMGKAADPIDRAYHELANAIVVKAVRDYQQSLISQHKKPGYSKAEAREEECVRFFHSDFYRSITKVDGDWLMKNAKQ